VVVVVVARGRRADGDDVDRDESGRRKPPTPLFYAPGRVSPAAAAAAGRRVLPLFPLLDPRSHDDDGREGGVADGDTDEVIRWQRRPSVLHSSSSNREEERKKHNKSFEIEALTPSERGEAGET